MLNGTQTPEKYWRYAFWLALFTIFYNLAEGWFPSFSASRTRR